MCMFPPSTPLSLPDRDPVASLLVYDPTYTRPPVHPPFHAHAHVHLVLSPSIPFLRPFLHNAPPRLRPDLAPPRLGSVPAPPLSP